MKIKQNLFCLLRLFILFSIIFITSCSPNIRFSNSTHHYPKDRSSSQNSANNRTSAVLSGQKMRGIASYYADKFEGRKTANGEIFRQSKFTAAHKTLPFGTMVKVTRLDNGKSIIVKINDRGPFVAGRIIDLSAAAAQKLGIIQDGLAEVEIEVLKTN